LGEKVDKERSEALKRMENLAATAQVSAEEKTATNRKLSEMILTGTEYFETVTVKALDGKEYNVKVHALNDEELREAIEKTGVDFKDLMNQSNPTIIGHWKLAQAIAPMATRDPQVCKALKPAESLKILKKVFEMSDLPFRAPTEPSGKPVQPST